MITPRQPPGEPVIVGVEARQHALFTASGGNAATAWIDARLAIAVARGLLLDVPATGDDAEVDAAMERFLQLLADQMKG
jgi:hypothetical protein